jgi:Glycine rich protein/PEP-CTERM motif
MRMRLSHIGGPTAGLALGLLAFTSHAAASAVLLFAAGGGGGASWEDTAGSNGLAGENASNGGGSAGGLGGLGGGGGQGGSISGSGGGGTGWTGPGGPGLGGSSGAGGSGFPTFSAGAGASFDGNFANGGFGGGGGGGEAGGGGGGGYSGGGGGGGESGFINGGGGGSYADISVTGATFASGSNGASNGSGVAGNNGYVAIGSTLFSYTGSVVDYTIPTSGDYFVRLAGAQGGSGLTNAALGGYGAVVSGSIDLVAGTDLAIVAGGAGDTGDFAPNFGGGGGGGSFIVELSVPTAVPPTPIPEPSTWAMMLIGFAGLGFAGWRGSRRAAAQA